MPEKILVICAHNDDQILGAGGTLAKAVKEGGSFATVIFSYGESSHPHLKEEIIKKKRLKEAYTSDKILGGSGIIFLGLKDLNFEKQIKEKNIKKHIEEIINKHKPTKIFTHSNDDAHPDHRDVYNLVKNLINENKIKSDVYSFDVWNFMKTRKRDQPRMITNISETFKTKIESFNIHESQTLLPGLILLRIKIYMQAIINGWKNNCKYGESFVKIL